MSAHSSDDDHNYYSRANRQSQIPDYDVNHAAAAAAASTTTPASLQTLPAYAYRQSQEYHAKRPKISTSFDRAPPAVARVQRQRQPDDSPDPHDFYSRYRDSFIRPSGSVYESLDTFGDTNGSATSAGGGHDAMASASTSQRTTPYTARSNGFAVSPLSARWHGRLDADATPSPMTERISPAHARANPPPTYVPRSRQTSLQALVNRFNQTPDEVPPVPRKPGSRSTSESRSPSTYTAAASFRQRASPETSQATHPANRHRAADTGRKGSGSSTSTARRHHATDHGPPPVKSPRNSRRASTMATHAAATQSMNDLSQSKFAGSKPPLFGEVVGNAPATLDPGYGIPRPRRRRGSEGNMHLPNAMFADDSSAENAGLAPSPTDWYKGVTPSLDGIDLDHPIPPKPPGLHRRSRSDMSASHAFTVAPSASSNGKTIHILSPPQEQPSPSPSPTSVRRSSQSRIPVSARRPSVASDSSASGPSSRAPSAASHYATHRKGHGKNRSGIAVAIQPLNTDHTASRSSTPRKSPRRRPSSPSRQPSPRLQAYISEAAPAKSPPLRSSRPRQSVSSATTSASRARAAANVVEQQAHARPKERPARRLPEVGTVDFAARRQRIQQAFTKSMIETEQAEERKRQSILHDPQLARGPENQPPLPTLPRLAGAVGTVTPPVPGERQGSREETFATPAEDFGEQQRGLTVDTGKTPEKPSLVISSEDSPTLGNATFVDPTREPDESSEEQEPMSAVTTGTTETFFDHEPQDSDEKEEPEHTPVAPPPATPPDPRHSATSDSPPSARRQLQSYNDQDEVGSIRIMLGETPVDDRPNHMGALGEQVEDLVDELGQGWGVEEPRSPEEPSVEPPEEHTPVRRPTNESQTTETTAHEYYGSPLWSAGSAGPLLTGNTLDSDSYNTISRVLDSYSDPSLMSPENISEFQQRLFSQSPDLARKGGWDTKKVTQLYLQGLRNKVAAASAVPKPLQFDAPRDEAAPPAAEPPQPPPAHPEGRRVDFEADDADEDERPRETEQIRSSAGLAVPAKILNRASLNNPDDWANTSPSMLDWFHRQATEGSLNDESPATPQFADADADLVRTPRGDRPLLPDIPRGGLGILDLPADAPAERRGSPFRSAHKGSPVSPSRKPLPPVAHERAKSPAKPTADVPAKAPPVEEPRPSVEVPRPVTPATAKPRPDDARAAGPDPAPSTAADATPKAPTVSAEAQKKLTRRRHIVKELVDTESSFGQDMKVVVDIYQGTSNVILVDSPEDVKTLFGNSAEIVAFSTRFLDSLKNAAKAVYVLPKSKRWRSKRDSSATTESRDTDDQASIGGLDLNDEDRDRLTTIGAAFLDHVVEMEKLYTEYLKNHDAANQKLQRLQKEPNVNVWLKECQTYASDLTTAWDLDSLLVKPVQRILKYSLFLKDLLEVTPENHPDFVKIDTAAREMVGVSKRINEAKKRADLIEQVTQPSRGKEKRKESESSRLAITKRFNLRPDKFKPPLGLVDLYQDRDYNAVSDKFGSHYFQLQVVMRDVEMYGEEVQAWVARFHDMVAAIKAYNDVAQTTYPEVESKWRLFQQSVHELQATALADHVAAVRKSVVEPMTTLLDLHQGPQKLMDKRKKRVAEFAKYKALRDRGEKADKKTTEQGEQFLAINETLKEELPRLFALTGKLVEACLNNFVQLQLQWQSVWKRKMIHAIELHEVPLSFDAVLEAFAGDFRYPEAQVLSLGICNGSLLADAANLVNLLTPSSSTLDDDSLRRASGPHDARTGTYGEEFRPRAQSYTTNEPGRPRGPSGPTGGSGVSPMLPAPDLGRPTESLGLGPHFPPPPPPPPPPTSAPNHAAPAGRNRLRASSNASSRSPSTPDMPGAWRTSGHSPSGFSGAGSGGGGGGGYAARPSTSTGRSYDPQQYSHQQRLDGPRHSSEAAHGRLRADGPHAPRPAPYSAHSQTGAPPQHLPPPPPPPPQQQQQPASHHAQQRYSGIFSSAMPMSDSPPGEPDPAAAAAAAPPSVESEPRAHPSAFNVLFLAASVYEFNIDRDRREAGYPYLTYVAGEIFDVIGEKGELWLAKNQDDHTNQVGWIWNKHFAKLAS